MRTIKKILKPVLITVLVLALAAGGIFGGSKLYDRYRTPVTVNVYSIMDNVMTDEWIGGGSENYGNVRVSNMQNVYISGTQTVTHINVEDGQEVHKGDVLFSYDTTLNDLNVERQKLNIERQKKQLEKLNATLQKVQSFHPGQKIPYSEYPEGMDYFAAAAPEYTAMLSGFSLTEGLKAFGRLFDLTGEPEDSEPEGSAEESTESITEEPSSEEQTTEVTEPSTEEPLTTEPATEEPVTEPETTVPAVTEPVKPDPNATYPEFLGGKGTEKSPYRYSWTQEYDMDKSFAAYVLRGQKSAYVTFEVYPDAMQEAPSFLWNAQFQQDGSYQIQSITLSQDIYDAMKETEAPEESTEEEPEESTEDWNDWPDFPDWPDYPDDPDADKITLTAEEIASMLSTVKQQIFDAELALRSAELELERMEAEISADQVKASIDGVVTILNPFEEASEDSSLPFLKISAGGGGYYVTCYVGEFDLDSVYVGKTVNISSYDSGVECMGEITEISDYPAQDYYYYSGGNNNVSYYPYTIFIDDSVTMENGEYVTITMEDESSDGRGFYLDNMFIRSDKTGSYVYIMGEDGTLVKQPVKTGAALWGSYTKILGGVSMDDYMAFPYGKDVKEGALAEIKDISELYNW